MTSRSFILCTFLIVAALSLTVSCAAFTAGNVIAIRADKDTTSDSCTKGYLTELTPTGEIVQEIALPTEEVNGTHPCLVYNNDYASRLTVSNDGYRAIMSCCNFINDTNSFLTSFAVIHGHGLIQTTTPFDADHSSVSAVYNAVLDGEDVWFSSSGKVYYTTLTSNTSTLVFSGDVFTLRSYEGNLYASNYDGLEAAIVQIGEGLPKTLSNSTVFLNQTWDTDAFEFSENYLTVGNYPNGLYVLNKTTHEIIYSYEDSGEIVQLVIFEDVGKILAHVDKDSTTIQKFTFDKMNGLANGTLWLNNYNTTAYYYFGLIKTPQDSCKDNVKNFDETDVDCGSSLCSARCVDGKACSVASDCSSNVCTNSVCGLPTPTTSTSSPISQKTPTAATSSANALLVNFITGVVLLGLITLV